MTTTPTREELIAAATVIHDEQGCTCDRKYLMSCQRLTAAILGLAASPIAPKGTDMDADQPKTLEEAARDEQMHLWSDLAGAVRTAHRDCWSVQCEDLTWRITRLAHLVGATPWGEIDVSLLRSGTYERILAEDGISHPPIDWAAVERTEAVIAGKAL